MVLQRKTIGLALLLFAPALMTDINIVTADINIRRNRFRFKAKTPLFVKVDVTSAVTYLGWKIILKKRHTCFGFPP